MGSLRGTSSASVASTGPPSRSGGGGGLGDIWGDSPGNGGGAVGAAGEERGSLRRGPLGGGRRGQSGLTVLPQETGLNVRPLPSQRAGSYQTRDQPFSSQQQQQQGEGRPGSGGGSSVQERLKARLGRGAGGGESGRSTPETEGGAYGRDDRRGGGGGGGGSYATQGLSGWQGRR